MGLLKTCILALSAITANAWDAAEKEAALKVVDECARGVQWWIFQPVADRIADESVAGPPARREPARPPARPARRRAQRLRRATSETGRGARERPARPSRHAASPTRADSARYGFPRLKAFDMMTPKLLLTVLKTYTTAMAPGAFEHFDAEAIETVYAAVSSSNNCEMCLSFHAMALGASASAEDIAEIVAGGLPKDPKMRTLVIASKYALAHKGIYLERERKHLAVLGIEGEKLVELTFLVGFMSAHNMNYVHLISQGLELEPMLQEVGPFAKTIYAKEGEL